MLDSSMDQSNFHYFIAGTLLKNDNLSGNPLGLSLFIKTIESNPKDYNTWLRTGEWLIQLAKNNAKYYLLGISCLKKAFSINPDSRAESYSYSNNLIDKETWRIQIASSIESLEDYKTNISLELIISEYHKILQPIHLAKQLAETKDVMFFEFLKYIIHNEATIAALKRIHYFKKDINLEFFSKELVRSKKKNEPFFSIALYYVNENWSKELFNKDIINKILQSRANSKPELDAKLYRIFGRILDYVEYRRFLHSIKRKEYERLYNAIRDSDIRVYSLQRKGIIDMQEELTIFGINCLEKYVGLLQ